MDYSGIDVEDLLQRLDISNARLTSSGDEVNFSCFGAEHSHGDGSPSAYINVETTAWFCHGCKMRGNALSMVMMVHDVARPAAERTLREWYGIEFNEPLGGSMVAEIEARLAVKQLEPEPIRPPQSWLSSTCVDWSYAHDKEQIEPYEAYMFDRGFSAETLDDWSIGYDYISDRVAIPVFDVEGELVGIKARDYTDQRQPKYLILGDRTGMGYGFNPYESGQVIFGLHRNRSARTAVLCEGELNAMALAQMGVIRPIATGMSYLTERHLQLIVREVDEVIIFYDHGDAGWEGTWGRRDVSGTWKLGAAQLLQPYVRVRVVQPLPEDPAEMMRQGRAEQALWLIDSATSSVALATGLAVR